MAKDKFGWSRPKSYNSPGDSHGDKYKSDKYSFKIPKKSTRSSKLWCTPGQPGVSKSKQSPGRPYGYSPVYDETDTYNYQSQSLRQQKALQRMPDRVWNNLYFYRASDGCYNHIVITPEFNYNNLLQVVATIPFEFSIVAPPEFWLNFPTPDQPTPGLPLIPGGNIISIFPPVDGSITWEEFINDINWKDLIDRSEWIDFINNNSDNLEDFERITFPLYRTRNFIPKLGCTDPEAENYDPEAEIDDGSCILPLSGCTDPRADNYDPNAVYNNGSCVYPEDDEPPEGPCDPPTCTLGPKYNSRWVVVDEATALSGGGCPVGYDNYGYAELADGTFQVLCQYIESAGSTFQRLWYRYPGEDWVKVDSSAGGLSSSCQDDETAYTVNWREVGSSEWNTVTSDSPITWTQQIETGQCPVRYSLRVSGPGPSRMFTNKVCMDGLITATSVNTFWGPILGIRLGTLFVCSGNRGTAYLGCDVLCHGHAPLLTSPRSASPFWVTGVMNSTWYSVAITSVSRVDGLPDDCGNCITTFSTGLVITRDECIEVVPENLVSTGLKKFEVKDNNGTLVSKKTEECPTVYLSCERPGDTPQSLDPKKIQDPRCPFVEEDE